MSVLRLFHLSKVVVGAFVLGASTVLFSVATLAADELESALISEVRKSAIYKYVGKGKVNLSAQVKERLSEFDNLANGALFFISEDGQRHEKSWCHGPVGCSTWGDPEYVKQHCENKLKQKCFLYKIGYNTSSSVPGIFREKVVWDYWYKSEAQLESERLIKEEEEERARIAEIVLKELRDWFSMSGRTAKSTEILVLGKTPRYRWMAEWLKDRGIRVKTFHVSDAEWKSLGEEREQWFANQAILGEAYGERRRSPIVLSNDATNSANLTGIFGKEVAVLKSLGLGYRITPYIAYPPP